MTSPRNDARRATTARAALLVATLAAAACGRSPAEGAPGGGMSRSGCAPGVTPLAPRTLASGSFSGLAWRDGAVVATGLDGVTSFPASGDPSTLIAHMNEARGLVATGDTAYFTATVPVGTPDPQGKVSSTTALFSVPFAGGVPTLVFGDPVNIDNAAADGAAVYVDGYGRGIVRVAVSDGASAVLPLPAALSIDSLAVQAGIVYVAAIDLGSMSATNGVIVKLPATGGAMQTVIANIGHPRSLVADASGLYWVEEPPVGQFGDGHIVRAGLDGKGVKTLLAHGAISLALSGGDLYLAGDSISKVPIGGGPEVPLVTGLMGAGLLVVSDGNAAWVDPLFQARSATTMPSLMTTCW